VKTFILIHFRGVGLLKAQILIRPSFKEGECWDFRENDDGIKIYKSIVLAEENKIKPGYFVVEANAEFVNNIFSKLQEFKVPLMVLQDNLATLDGTSYSVRITNGVENHICLSWSSTPPYEWSEFIALINNIVDTLRTSNINEVKV
jgi:hypothetical protein